MSLIKIQTLIVLQMEPSIVYLFFKEHFSFIPVTKEYSKPKARQIAESQAGCCGCRGQFFR